MTESEILKLIENLKFSIGAANVSALKSARSSFRDLWDAEVKVFSQWGEDGILDFLCDKTKLSKPKVIEIGAGQFQECNSRFICESRNASAVLIDSDSNLVKTLEVSELLWKNHIFAIQEFVTSENANRLVEQSRVLMGGADILSLDIDGNDFWVMSSIHLIDISIVVVEYNPLFGFKEPVAVPKDDLFDRRVKHHSWLYCGVSLPAWVLYFSNKGYQFIGTNRVGNNAFFVKNGYAIDWGFELPTTLSKFTDWRIRESRDVNSKMNYLSNNERIAIISHLPVVRTDNGVERKVGDIQ